MKIATHNVRNLYDPGTVISEESNEVVDEAFFNKRITYLTEKYQKLDVDVICLQEIGGELGVIRIGEALGYDYFFAKPNKRGIRMAVLYKKELSGTITCNSVSFGDIVIPSIQTQGDTASLLPIQQRRDVLVVDIDSFLGKKLRIVTFHLKSMLPMYLEGDDVESDTRAYVDARFRSVFYKTMELRALRYYVETSLDEGRELVLLGDFNEDSNASSVSILKGSNKEERVLFDVLTGYTGNATTHMYRGNMLTFDTILVSDNIRKNISSVSVENDDLKDYSVLGYGEIEHVVEPDHAMVIVEVKG